MRLTQRIAGWFQHAPSAHPQQSLWRQPRFERLEDRLVLSYSPAAVLVVPPDGGSDAGVDGPKPPSIEAPPTPTDGGEGQAFPEAVDIIELELLDAPNEATAPIDNAGEPAPEMPGTPADGGQLAEQREPAQPLSDEVCPPIAEPCSCDVQAGPELLGDPSVDAASATDEATVFITLDCDLDPLPVQRDVGDPTEGDPLGPIEDSGIDKPPYETAGDEPILYLDDWGPLLESFPVLTTFGDAEGGPEVRYFSVIPGPDSAGEGSLPADPSPYTHGWFAANLSPSLWLEPMFSGPGSETHGQGLTWDRPENNWPQAAPASDAHDAALLAYIYGWDATNNDPYLGRPRPGTGGMLGPDTGLTVWRDAVLDKLADAAKLDDGLVASVDAVPHQDDE